MLKINNTWHAQKKQLLSGEITAKSLTASYLERIRTENERIKAITQVLDSLALDTAERVDNGSVSGPLAGLCLVVKDMIDIASAHCSGGLAYLKERVPDRDADIVADLRKAGTNILGMGVTDTGGFGIRTPEVIHPLAPERIVGGSSGGSAAAVAADFSPVSLGTDSGGSIRIPAACCGLKGFKPTWGRISTKGIIPFSPTMDHVGLLAKSVEDISMIIEVLDPGLPNPSQSVSTGEVKIGVDHGFYREADVKISQTMIEAEKIIRSLGAEIVQLILPQPDHISLIHDPIVAKESTDIHGKFFDKTTDLQKPVVKSTLVYGSTIDQRQYRLACRNRVKLQQTMDDLFEVVDFIMIPTMPCLPPKKEEDMLKLGKHFYPIDIYLRRYTCLFNVSRHPVISLPVKTISPGVGISIQIAGPFHADKQLLSFASILEKELQKK